MNGWKKSALAVLCAAALGSIGACEAPGEQEPEGMEYPEKPGPEVGEEAPGVPGEVAPSEEPTTPGIEEPQQGEQVPPAQGIAPSGPMEVEPRLGTGAPGTTTPGSEEPPRTPGTTGTTGTTGTGPSGTSGSTGSGGSGAM